MSECCDINKLKEFIDTSKPNDKFIYYIGIGVTDSILSNEIGRFIYDQSVRGRVYLVTRRVYGYPEFEFIAIKASSPPVYKLLPLPQEKLQEKYRSKLNNYGAKRYAERTS